MHMRGRIAIPLQSGHDTKERGERLMRNFDYVIVGAGSDGCTLANRLSEVLCLFARSWTSRPVSVDTHSNRLREDHVPQGLQLGLRDRARSQP